jgi:raffinose/stachyose/melibiose transport system substrate-binding protein
MKKPRAFILSFVIIATLLLTIILTGCAQPTPAAAPVEAPQQPVAEVDSQPPGERVKIVYWSMFSEGEPLQKLLEDATKEFMVEYPNIQVEIQWAGRQVLTQLQSAIAAGTQVDIVDHSDDRVYNALVVNGLAYPLDKYLDEKAYDSDMTWRETFKPGALDLGMGPDGKTYLIPRDDYISAFFFNANMFEEAGIQPKVTGMTWDEFNQLLDTIKNTNPGVSPLGADGTISFYNNWWASYLFTRIAGKDAFRDAAYDKSGENWGNPEFLQAANMIRDLQDRGVFQRGFEGSVWPSAQVQWVNGDIAMMFMGAWLPKEMSEQMPEGFKIDLFAFPTVDNGKGNQLVEHWANTFGVLSSTKNPDEVGTYLKYLLSKKVGTKIAESGVPVPLQGVPVPPALENQYKIIEVSETMPARAGLNTEIPDYMDNVFNTCHDRFFQLQLNPEGFIECLKTESRSYWARQQ